MDCKVILVFVLFLSQCLGDEVECSAPRRDGRTLDAESLKKISDLMEKNVENYGAACRADITTWSSSLPDMWALQMLDSGGGLPSGILKGNLNSLGNFDECVETSHMEAGSQRSIRGKYCLARVPAPSGLLTAKEKSYLMKTSKIDDGPNFGKIARVANIGDKGLVFNIALCIPASCNGTDFQTAFRTMMNQESRSCSTTISGLSALTRNVSIPDSLCKTKEPVVFSPADWGAVSVLSFFGLLIVLSTSYELWVRFFKKDPSKVHPVMSSFSLYMNTQKLFSVSQQRGPLRCLHGIRVLSMFWIILSHRYSANLLFPSTNFIDVLEWMQTFASTPIMAAAVAVDTFFILSGLLLAYVFFRQMEKEKFFNIPMFYVHRIIRLTPALAIMIFLEPTLFRHMGTGPMWNFFNLKLVENCQKYWWTTLLYVQNYVNPMDTCVDQSWYLAVDMQLYILSPIILYPLLKWPKPGMIMTVIWTVLSIISVLIYSLVHKWAAAQFSLNNENNSDGKVELTYMATHTRATPWLMGFIAGYFLRISIQRNLKLNKVVAIVGWIISLSMLGAVILGMKPLQQNDHIFSHAQDTMYIVFHRVAWSLGVIWVIVACVHGCGGLVNWFLSLKIWEILGHLTYAMYLVHVPIQYTTTYAWRYVPKFDNLNIVHIYFGDLLLTLIFAYILAVSFESPILVLENILLRKRKSTLRPEPERKEITIHTIPDKYN